MAIATQAAATSQSDIDQAALTAALEALVAHLRAALRRANGPSRASVPSWPLPVADRSTLARVRERFDLSPFEIAVVVLTAAVELQPEVDDLLCKVAGTDENRGPVAPSFGLALSVLPGGHWDAFTPTGPLRHYRLVRLGDGDVLMRRPVRIEERLLHALMGATSPEPCLARRMLPLEHPSPLAPAQEQSAVRVCEGLFLPDQPPIHLLAADVSSVRAIAANACAKAQLRGYRLDATQLPSAPLEQEELLSLWARENGLCDVALLLELPAHGPDELMRSAVAFIERVGGPVLIGGTDVLPDVARTVVRVEIPGLAFHERVDLWREALRGLPRAGNDDTIHATAAQFHLDPSGIRSSADAVRLELRNRRDATLDRALWNACRATARPRLADLAQHVPACARLDQVILPQAQRRVLNALIGQLRHRARVHHGWGFDALGERGGGTAAVFAGPSGTGKTMAAEAIANELALDLFRVDLSAVVSKYIGETEENLRKVFDAAEAGGAILLFDEADALFGKRTEVRDANDRHANVEVGYLLQRMEIYSGLVLLTTNLRKAIDDAFLRRMQFIVDFPFPDVALREQIWRGVFPAKTPRRGLDPKKLARLAMAGGNIRSIARNAAYLAADTNGPVTMAHLLEAARFEYAKLGKSLPPSDIHDWTLVEGGDSEA